MAGGAGWYGAIALLTVLGWCNVIGSSLLPGAPAVGGRERVVLDGDEEYGSVEVHYSFFIRGLNQHVG